MTQINILQFPDARLRTKGAQVTDFDSKFQTLIDNMFETHYTQESCAALAATQLDLINPPRVTVIDFSLNKDQPLCLVNPVITAKEGKQSVEEGCMSVGDGSLVSAVVERAQKITVQAQDRHGNDIQLEAENFLAQCIQHELDHLDGILFIDYLSSLKRKRLLAQLEKQRRWQKENAAE